MTNIIPYGPRLAIVDPPADEQQTHSGLIVPASLDLERLSVGIVVNGVKPDDDPGGSWSLFGMAVTSGVTIETGSLVYYTGIPFRVGDVKIINMTDVVAFERP